MIQGHICECQNFGCTLVGRKFHINLTDNNTQVNKQCMKYDHFMCRWRIQSSMVNSVPQKDPNSIHRRKHINLNLYLNVHELYRSCKLLSSLSKHSMFYHHINYKCINYQRTLAEGN